MCYMFSEKLDNIRRNGKIRKVALAGLFSAGMGMNVNMNMNNSAHQIETRLQSKSDLTARTESVFDRLNSVYRYFEGQVLSANFPIKSAYTPIVRITHNLVSIQGYDEHQTQINSASRDGTAVYRIDYRTPVIFGKTNTSPGYIPDRSSISIQVNPGIKNSQFAKMKSEGVTSFAAVSMLKGPNGNWNVQWMGNSVIGSVNFPSEYSFKTSPNLGPFIPAKEVQLDECLSKMEGIITAARRGESLASYGPLEYIRPA